VISPQRRIGHEHREQNLLFHAARESLKDQLDAAIKERSVMPKLIATHEVDDVAHWLASPKREEVFSGVATNITTFVHLGVPNRVALSMDVADMDAFDAVMKSEAGAAAMKYDGVRPETLDVFLEG
jgi:hypothetical protein